MKKMDMGFRVLRYLVVMVVFFGVGMRGAFAVVNAVSVRAVVDKEPLVQGEDGRVGIEMVVDPAYHVQSAKPLDKYLIPFSVKVKVPEGVRADEVEFPVAREITASPLISTVGKLSVYEGTVYVVVPLRVALDAAVGDGEIEVNVREQACDEHSCLPPKTLTIKIPVKVAEVGAASVPKEEALFAAADKQGFAVLATTKPVQSLPITTETAPQNISETTPKTTPNEANGLTGKKVVLLSPDEQVAVINSRLYKAGNSAEHDYPVGLLVIFALVGGMILNVMPCVLPVIPLKVLSLVQQAHGDRRLAVLHGLTFSAGVVSLFVALAVVLKTFGLFYGQQFQSPAFLIVMVMFVVALALSMMSVWTINPPTAVYGVETSGHGHLSSFTSGLMATLLATPCSAPYLGPVLGWALVQPTWLTVMMLGLVGVGMSLPYLVLAAFPGWLKKVPRAGRWSELLKQGLGIVMLGVAVYLLTLLSDVRLWPWVMLGMVVVGLVCWGWGQLPSPTAERGRMWGIRVGVLFVGAMMGVGVIWMGMRAVGETAEGLQSLGLGGESVVLPAKGNGEWMAFNVALLDEGLKEGRPVVVDWGADWCINCRFLEATVLGTEGVKKAFAESNAVLLRADLSNDNPAGTALNKKLGGEAIPVLAVFSPGRVLEPVVLRDSYSVGRVVEEVGRAR